MLKVARCSDEEGEMVQNKHTSAIFSSVVAVDDLEEGISFAIFKLLNWLREMRSRNKGSGGNRGYNKVTIERK